MGEQVSLAWNGDSVMRSKCAWRGLSWKQSAMGTLSCTLSVPGVESVGSRAMGTLSCALSVPGVASVGSGLIRAQWGLCHAL